MPQRMNRYLALYSCTFNDGGKGAAYVSVRQKRAVGVRKYESVGAMGAAVADGISKTAVKREWTAALIGTKRTPAAVFGV
ncbi:hypothetical protein FACS189490_09720 [Clostridia bacterium]|nr:hypothetical protein FACS189490_09720 [Clostridia bacterium]